MLHPSHDSSAAGFTLIELLVSIAIVLILIALVFSVGGQALQSAQAVKCSGNLRQIGFAFSSYLTDNNGNFPKHPTNAPASATWDMQIMGYLENSGYNFLSVMGTGLDTTANLSVANLFKCPVDRGPRAVGKYPRSYAITTWTCNDGGTHYSTSLPQGVGVNVNQLDPGSASRSAVLVECPAPMPPVGNIIAGAPFAFSTRSRYDWSDLHGKRANILFADWHVELISQKDSGTTANAFIGRYYPPESPFWIANQPPPFP